MAKGRQGFMLEGWKFGVYLLIPIAASVYYNNTENQKKAADYWQYVKYPANPTTGYKESMEAIASQQKQRELYRQQLQQLNDPRPSHVENSTAIKSDQPRRRWLQWGWWMGRDNDNSNQSRPLDTDNLSSNGDIDK